MSGERRDSQRKVVNPFRSSRVATTRDTEPYPYCPLWALNGTEIAKLVFSSWKKKKIKQNKKTGRFGILKALIVKTWKKKRNKWLLLLLFVWRVWPSVHAPFQQFLQLLSRFFFFSLDGILPLKPIHLLLLSLGPLFIARRRWNGRFSFFFLCFSKMKRYARHPTQFFF